MGKILTIILLSLTALYGHCANAALLNGSTLSFTPAVTGGMVMPAIGDGSWMALQVTPTDFLYTHIDSLNGIILGTSQPASSIPPVGDIDSPWMFSGSNGVHLTNSNSNVLTSFGDSATIDFSGWNIDWTGILVNLGSNAWNGNSDGVANVTCETGSGCGGGASYLLDYSATIPVGDPSGLGGIKYALHIEGFVSAVPVPAAVWLFGSGLLGLIGFSYRSINNNHP